MEVLDLPSASNTLDEFNLRQGNADYIELTGFRGFLRKVGINFGSALDAKVTFEQRATVSGSDGHAWEVWGDDLFVHARRRRTAGERTRWIDQQNGTISTRYFSKDRQMMCLEIALEITDIVRQIDAALPMPRASRRLLKRRLAVFSAVQADICCRADVDMAWMRERLASAGLFIAQAAYSQ